jgi:hypothetical protein
MTMSNLKVVPFTSPNLRDIPAMLRLFADDIEAGKHGEISKVMMAAMDSDECAVFGFGDVGSLAESIGIFHLASAILTRYQDD